MNADDFVPPPSAPAATPEPERATAPHQCRYDAGGLCVICGASAPYRCSVHGYNYDESCCGEDFRQTFLAIPGGAAKQKQLAARLDAYAYAVECWRDGAPRARADVEAIFTAQASELAALRARVRETFSYAMIEGHRWARNHVGPLPGSVVGRAADDYARAALTEPTE